MGAYTLKVYGRNARFQAKSMTQALFARDKHIEHLRAKARVSRLLRRRNKKALAAALFHTGH